MEPGQVESAHGAGLLERAAASSCGTYLAPGYPSTFWYEQITHNGMSPFIPSGSLWKIFRNVVTGYGADNSGNTASDGSIQNAINGEIVSPHVDISLG